MREGPDAERRDPSPGLSRNNSVAQPRSTAANLLALQRRAGNRATQSYIAYTNGLATSVTISPSAPSAERESNASSPSGTIQRVVALIDYSIGGAGEHRVVGDQMGLMGQGGVSHSEQTAWAKAKAQVLAGLRTPNTHVDIQFEVDAKVCHLCTPWFENALTNELNGACADGSNYTLEVDVTFQGTHGHVVVNGTDTIWPPEVADDTTYERLSSIDRTMLFLEEGRQGAGGEKIEDRNPYGVDQARILSEAIEQYQWNGLGRAEVQQAFEDGKDNAMRENRGRFAGPQEPDLPDTAEEFVDGLELWQAVEYGSLSIPVFNTKIEQAQAVKDWLASLRERTEGWTTYQVETHYNEVQKIDQHILDFGKK
jgi:hypothetical protein